jgi:hypothetical protein
LAAPTIISVLSGLVATLGFCWTVFISRRNTQMQQRVNALAEAMTVIQLKDEVIKAQQQQIIDLKERVSKLERMLARHGIKE